MWVAVWLVFLYNLDDDPSKMFFLMLGIEIVLTAVGCLASDFYS